MPISHIELTIKDRVLQVVKEKKLNIKGLSEKYDLKHRTLTDQIYTQDAKLSCSFIYLIANEHHDVSLEWLMTGRGEMIKPAVQINQPNEIQSLSFRLNSAAPTQPVQQPIVSNPEVEQLKSQVEDYKYMVELQRFKIKKLEEQLKAK